MAARRQAQVRAGNEPPDSAHSDWPRLGSRIRAAREGLGLSLAEVAERAVVGDYTMGQVEAGAADPGRRVVEILDAEFGAEGVLVDAWAQVYISHHVRTGSPINEICREAAQVRAFAPLMIPDHVQTTDYTHALDTAERPMEPHYHVADRPRLPRLMATGSGPPFHCLVLDESALHRSVGTPDIMRDQMAHLHRLAQAAHVTVHIIPSGTPHHPGLRGAFWTLAFSPRHTLAYIPCPRGPGHLVTDAVHIKGYADLFATLQGAALPAGASLALLAEAADQARPRRAITTGTTGTADPSALGHTAPARTATD